MLARSFRAFSLSDYITMRSNGADESSSVERQRFLSRLRRRNKPLLASSAPAAVVVVSSPPPKIDTAQAPRATSPPMSPPRSKPVVSLLCRTGHFQNLCEWAFDLVDTDQSGTVDEKELYSGLLLIHLKLGTYAGPAACRPLARERCRAMFHAYDADQSGALSRDEFSEVMMVLFSNVLIRVVTQWCMTLMIVPLIAHRILNGISWLIASVTMTIANLDQYSPIFAWIEMTITSARDRLWSTIPDFIVAALGHANHIWHKIPSAVWSSVPLTLVSTLLGILVVPWCIMKIDDFFQWLANRHRTIVDKED